MKLKSQSQMNANVLQNQLEKLEKKYCKTIDEKKKILWMKETLEQMTKQKEKLIKSFHIKLNRTNFNQKTDSTSMKNILAEILKHQKINKKKLYSYQEIKKNMLFDLSPQKIIVKQQQNLNQETEIQNELYCNQILQNKKKQLQKDISTLNKNIQIYKIQLRQIVFCDFQCQDIQNKQKFDFIALQSQFFYIEKKKQRSESLKSRNIQRKKSKKMSIRKQIDNDEYEIYIINKKKSELKEIVDNQRQNITILNQTLTHTTDKLQKSQCYINTFQILEKLVLQLQQDQNYTNLLSAYQDYFQHQNFYSQKVILNNYYNSIQIKQLQFFIDYFVFLKQKISRKQNDFQFFQNKKIIYKQYIQQIKKNTAIYSKFMKQDLVDIYQKGSQKKSQKYIQINNCSQFLYELNMSICLYQERASKIFHAATQICELLDYNISKFELSENQKENFTCNTKIDVCIYSSTIISFNKFVRFFEQLKNFTNNLLISKIEKIDPKKHVEKRKQSIKRRDSKIVIRPQCSIQEKDESALQTNQSNKIQEVYKNDPKNTKTLQNKFKKKFNHVNKLSQQFCKKENYKMFVAIVSILRKRL